MAANGGNGPPMDTASESDDEDGSKRKKRITVLEKQKMTYDFNGKLMPVKEPNLKVFKVINPEIYIA